MLFSIRTRCPRHASSHYPPFFSGFREIFRLVRFSRSALGTPGSLTRRSATSSEAKHARTLSRRPDDGTRDENPARASPRAFAKRAAATRVPILAFCLFLPFREAMWRKTQRASTGASSRKGDARARKRERATFTRPMPLAWRQPRPLDQASRPSDLSPPTDSRPAPKHGAGTSTANDV